MKPSRLLLVPLAGLAITLLVACGGDKKDSKAARNSDNSGTSASQARGSGSSASTSLDLSQSGTKLAELKSFRFDVTAKLNLGSLPSSSSTSSDDAFGPAMIGALLGGLGDIKAEGSFVSPDKSDIRLKLAGQEMGMIQIGDKAWVKFGNTWQPTAASESPLGSGSPADMFKGAMPNEVLKDAKTSKETVNGTKTTHYSFDKKALEKLTKAASDSADLTSVDNAKLDLWVSEDNVPVKMALSMNGKDDKGQKVSIDLEFNIKDINGNVQIKAPI